MCREKMQNKRKYDATAAAAAAADRAVMVVKLLLSSLFFVKHTHFSNSH